ncbi:hypothetical protein, unlikely [Trypanosoma brucei gambiense DAL972]|uniref:Uncharacterized protein n=1 Tax=Trypanosoma brucei gambiense (strain MHOM/CI/86/DAL972) TaxID=679716 RepID=D0AA34_TRYB9|nr:hypothetical protein, unlikely [Trypanosoma brucei gambiense DAL972]CBH18535.1 hypothetical protein, unlikely [Trypanosoma brucei gambiense DAL972]|eukprot:XP_011780799.1 hypothetical protein, unlikely [Trypanosoma brucei gambiense DAL972]
MFFIIYLNMPLQFGAYPLIMFFFPLPFLLFSKKNYSFSVYFLIYLLLYIYIFASVVLVLLLLPPPTVIMFKTMCYSIV